MDKEKLHQILSSLWKNDDSVGKTYYNQALQDVQTAIDLQEESISGLDNGDMPIERWKQAVKAASNQRSYRSSKGLTETRDDYFVDGVQWADEHPLQKPIEWSKEDDKHLQIAINYTFSGGYLSTVDWLKSLKNRCIPQQTPAWSEEDETKIKSIIALLKSPALCCMDGNKGIIDKNIKYLKSLKDRVQSQSKQEWSEEDIDNLNRISVILNDARQVREWWKDERLITKEESDKLITFLKSLKPQNTWKPSDKQLNNILDVLSFDNCTPKRRELLESLYNDLNKLRGE